DVPRVAVRAGELARTLRRLDVVELDDAALGLRDDLLREDDHVAVFEGVRSSNELGDIRAGADLGQALEGQDRQAHRKPVECRPATTGTSTMSASRSASERDSSERSSLATLRAGDSSDNARAVSSIAPAFVARTTSSTPRTDSSLTAPSTPSSAAASSARAGSREPRTTSSPAACNRIASARPNGPVPPTIATFKQAPTARPPRRGAVIPRP